MGGPRGHRRGAVVWAAVGAIILFLPLGDFDFARGNLPVLADNLPLLLFIVGLPATQGILVGVAVRHFHADMWEGAGLGIKIGILYGVIFVVIFVIVILTGVGTICDDPGYRGSQYEPEWCWILLSGSIIFGMLFLVVVGTGTGLVVSWMSRRRHPWILY